MNALNLYDLASWTSGTLGIALLLMGLFARRIVVRKTPRCSRCGYELPSDQHHSVIRCSECGRIPKNGGELYTLRRGRMLIVLGMMMCIGAVLVSRVPQIRVQGWASVLPVSVQIRLWEVGDNRLRVRIKNLHNGNRLSSGQRELLKRKIRDVLADPQSSQQLLPDTLEYYTSFGKKRGILDEADLSQALRTGSDGAVTLILIFHERYPPQTAELFEARRSLLKRVGFSGSDKTWEWIFREPDLEQDFPIIRDAIINSTDEEYFLISGKIDKAIPQIFVRLVPLLEDASARTQLRVINALIAAVDNDQISDELDLVVFETLLSYINSSDELIRQRARQGIEGMPPVAFDLLDALYRRSVNNELTRDLLYRFRRMDSWASALIPAVYSIAEDTSRSIAVRLDAHDACVYVQRRSRSGEVPSPLPIYIDALDQMDMRSDEGIMRLGRLFGGIEKPVLLAAVGSVLDRDGIDSAEAAGRWLVERPALETLIRVSALDLSPEEFGQDSGTVDMLQMFMQRASDSSIEDPAIADAIVRGLEILGSRAAATSP